MGQKNQLWWDLPAIDTLELNRAIYEIPKRKYEETLDELVSILEVKKLLNVAVRRLSLGQRVQEKQLPLKFFQVFCIRQQVLRRFWDLTRGRDVRIT